ncbi:MAG: hypothetical protein IJ537_10795 [Bacteroidaceae bacterium]|nr:hypothetical protein [Bacteroidaceae bacterium]
MEGFTLKTPALPPDRREEPEAKLWGETLGQVTAHRHPVWKAVPFRSDDN